MAPCFCKCPLIFVNFIYILLREGPLAHFDGPPITSPEYSLRAGPWKQTTTKTIWISRYSNLFQSAWHLRCLVAVIAWIRSDWWTFYMARLCPELSGHLSELRCSPLSDLQWRRVYSATSELHWFPPLNPGKHTHRNTRVLLYHMYFILYLHFR